MQHARLRAVDCPQRAIPDLLEQLLAQDADRTILLFMENSPVLRFAESMRLAIPVDIAGGFTLTIPDQKSVLAVYIDARTDGQMASALYSHFQNNNCYYDVHFLIIKDPLFDFEYLSDVVKIPSRRFRICVVGEVNYAVSSIIYARMEADVPREEQAINQLATSVELCQAYRDLKTGRVKNLFSVVLLPFSAPVVQVISFSTELCACVHSLGWNVHILDTLENRLLLKQYRIAVDDTAGQQPEHFSATTKHFTLPDAKNGKNQELVQLFKVDSQQRFHQLVSWRNLVGSELAHFVISVIGFTKVTWAQKIVISRIRAAQSGAIYFDSQFKPGNGVTFGIFIGCLWYSKSRAAHVLVVSCRAKWQRVFQALQNSSVSGALRRVILAPNRAVVNEEFSGLIVEIAEDEVRLAFDE